MFTFYPTETKCIVLLFSCLLYLLNQIGRFNYMKLISGENISTDFFPPEYSDLSVCSIFTHFLPNLVLAVGEDYHVLLLRNVKLAKSNISTVQTVASHSEESITQAHTHT